MIGETAQLAVELNLGGNFGTGMAAAGTDLEKFNTAAATAGTHTGALSGALGTVERAATGFGGALSHAGSQLKGLLMGPLGVVGLTGGLLTVGGALEEGFSKAQTWGLQIEKLQGITGNTAESLSGLLAVTEKYGLSNERLSQIAGFTEKALGNLTKGIDDSGAAVQGAKDFTDEFGFSIYDAHGKVKDFSSLLLTFADYWKNGAETPAEKAAAAAKLFGRGYADLVPILNLGAQGIRDAEEEARALGLTLTTSNVEALAKAREATRQWGDALSGLELQLGLALLPKLTDLAQWGTSFVATHGQDIIHFFTGLADFAGSAAGTIGNLVGTASRFWDSLPGPFRDLLVKGFVADKTIKFLFGFDPAGAAIGALKDAFATGAANALGKSLAQAGLGKLFVQPVFVTNEGFGGGGVGALEGLAADGAAAGALPVLLVAGTIAALGVAFVSAMQQHYDNNYVPTDQGGSPHQIIPVGRGYGPDSGHKQRTDLSPTQGPRAGDDTAVVDQLLMQQRSATEATKDLDQSVTYAAQVFAASAERFANPDWMKKIEAGWTKAGQTLHAQVSGAMADLAAGRNTGAAAAFLGTHLGSGGFGAFGYKAAETVLSELQSLGTGDPAVVAAIHQLEAKLPRLKTDAVDLAKAEEIAQNQDPKNKKLDDLNRVMSDLRAHGDATTRAKVQDLINAVKAQKTHITINPQPAFIQIVSYGTNETGRTVQKTVSRGGSFVVS